MSTLLSLKLTAQQKPTKPNSQLARRQKLLGRLAQQIELAKAQINGTKYTATRLRSVKNAEGIRTQMETQVRVKNWWYTADNGKLALSVRYGTSILELAKNKYAIEVGTERDLVAVLETVRTATLNGELDNAMATASTKLRAAFGK